MTIRPLIYAVPLVLAGWLAILVLVGLLSDEAPARFVPFPSAQLIGNLPPETSIVRFTDWGITLSSSQPHFARALYENGAWIVLPSGLNGCLPL